MKTPLPIVAELKAAQFGVQRFYHEPLQVHANGPVAMTTKSEWVDTDTPERAALVIEALYTALLPFIDGEGDIVGEDYQRAAKALNLAEFAP